MKVYEAYARAFHAEGVDRVFGLMGDGNMFWMSQMATLGTRVVHARHETAAITMADAYARKTGSVGVATITCGPGLTHALTTLVVATREQVPMVVFAGDSPMRSSFYLQEIDQPGILKAAGVACITPTSSSNVGDDVRRAFHLAWTESKPVVMSVPMDLQEDFYDWPWFYTPSGVTSGTANRVRPSDDSLVELKDMLADAERPVLFAGRGAVLAGAGPAIAALAARCDARLATSLMAKGLFDGDPRNIGLGGAFADAAAREIFASADLVVAIGARLGHFSSEGGYLFPEARVVSIDIRPQMYKEGLWAFEKVFPGDAHATVTALCELFPADAQGSGGPPSNPPQHVAPVDMTSDWTTSYQGETAADPEVVAQILASAIDPEWNLVLGIGHFWNFLVPAFSGRAPENYTFTCDFGCIGLGLPAAIGVVHASQDPATRTVLVEGDGSLLQNIGELEVVGRDQLPLLTLIMNDGAYGAEIHKLRAKGMTEENEGLAIFGRPDFAAIASGFGMHGVRADSPLTLQKIIAEFAADPRPTLVDIPITRAPSPQYRRLYFGESSS